MIRILGLSAALLCAGVAGACGRHEPESTSRPNVLLVTIDTFRADRLGVGVAPNLDRMTTSSIRFTNARSAVPLTLPSHTTILTGLLPPAHGVRENGLDSLDGSRATIATLLKNTGYQTAAFVGAFVLDRRFGLSRGFDTYDDRIPRDPNASERLEAERPASAVVGPALAWLGEHATPGTGHPAPFFVWIHLYDPHAPYNPPPEFRARAKSAYDGEIAYADSQIARVFDWLRAQGLDRRTLIIVAGDHGEGLGDHGESTHGMLLYDSTLRVPLVVSAPGRNASTVDRAVGLADIAPTILSAAGVATPGDMKGQDLLRPLTPPGTSDPASGVRDLYSETDYPRVAGWSPLQALTDGRWMAIRSGAATELYDLQSDPQEQRDVAAAQPSTAAALSTRIDAIRASGGARTPGTVSAETAERLRSLGYVASSAQPATDAHAPNPARHIDAWNAFEDALALLNQHSPAALPALDAIARANPDAPVFRSTYARALKERGRLADAIAVYRAASHRWPTDAVLMHDYAVAAREAAAFAPDGAPARKGLLEEAVNAEQAAAMLQPGSAMVHNGLGLIAADGNDPASAAREFERATALDPNNASYWANLGNARRSVGNVSGAEQAYRRALDTDARTVDAANGLGVLLVEAKRPGEAVGWFQRAIDQSPDFVEARLNLGIALQQAGDAVHAREAYRAVLASAGSHTREKDAASKLLASLGGPR